MKKRLIMIGMCTAIMFALHPAFVIAQDPTEVTAQLPPEPSTPKDYSDDGCDPTTNKDCYQLLESIPLEGRTIDSINTTASGSEGGIGGFINFMFEMGIGIAGVLGVIMLVIYGFQYASNDNNINTFGKLKEKIGNVILGLLLLLSIFIILNTINPDLLVVEPEIQTKYLDIEESGDGLDDVNFTPDGNFSGPAPKSCPAGITKVQGINVCKTLAEKLDAMLTAAKSSGVILGGGGFRTMEEQLFLRNKNCRCGGNQSCIYNKRSSQCSPPTARPGSSRHQSGLAIDFTCGNYGIINVGKRPATAVCFNWMKANANKYGFYNLPSENWHWSVDGK